MLKCGLSAIFSLSPERSPWALVVTLEESRWG